MKKYILKNIHSSVGSLNGSLYFTLNERLLRIDIGTPNFNDYNEWRLEGINYSPLLYNEKENSGKLKPLGMKNISLNCDDLIFLEILSELINSDRFVMSDDELFLFNEINKYNVDLTGEMYKGNRFLFNEGNTYGLIDYATWKTKEEKTSFEKIFYPILYECALLSGKKKDQL